MSALFQDRSRADAAVEKLKAYAQPQRLMILSCLLQGERTVSDIDAATGIGQPALSQQLAELRRADMVTTRRVAKRVYYDLANDDIRLCVRSMEAIFGNAPSADAALLNILRTDRGVLTSGADNRTSGAAVFAKIG
jgi:DNA-binding transcriptional ArsR family regulator